MASSDESFFQRNSSCLWFGGGCCSCLVILLIAMVALPVGGIAALFTGLRSSDVYQVALERAQSDPTVVEALGEPIEPGILFSGSINFSGSSGEADYSVPLRGPRGRATLYVIGQKRAGEWTFELMEVEIQDTGERVDLLGADGSSGSLAPGAAARAEEGDNSA